VQELNEMPRVTVFEVTLRAAAATVARLAPFSKVACDLVDEQHTGNAARLGDVRNCNIIADNHHLDLFAEAAGALGRKSEVKPISGVVRNKKKTATFSGYGQNRCQDRIKTRRGKHFAANRCGEHALADKAGVRWLVA
jgi:hypothetical protein